MCVGVGGCSESMCVSVSGWLAVAGPCPERTRLHWVPFTGAIFPPMGASPLWATFPPMGGMQLSTSTPSLPLRLPPPYHLRLPPPFHLRPLPPYHLRLPPPYHLRPLPPYHLRLPPPYHLDAPPLLLPHPHPYSRVLTPPAPSCLLTLVLTPCLPLPCPPLFARCRPVWQQDRLPHLFWRIHDAGQAGAGHGGGARGKRALAWLPTSMLSSPVCQSYIAAAAVNHTLLLLLLLHP